MKRSGKKSRTGRKPVGPSEWVGGRLKAPFHVQEGGLFRPDMILWMELPDELILHGTVIDPKEPPASFSPVLQETMRAPMVGPPRRPDRIRVADPGLADELRTAVPDIEIVVAPTPELNRVLRHMAESFPK